VKHTEDGDWLDGDERIGDIIQNGVKETYDDCSDNIARVEGIIRVGKKII
jgi:5-methylcytosine-specific restriction endonuclease McrBC regulatory subunit McrC